MMPISFYQNWRGEVSKCVNSHRIHHIVTESAGENGPGATLCFWGTKAGPGIHSGLKWVRSTLSHVDMQSLYMYIVYPSISLSVFPTPHHPSPGLDKRGELARHRGWLSRSKSKRRCGWFGVLSNTIFIQQNPPKPQKQNQVNICIYLSHR